MDRTNTRTRMRPLTVLANQVSVKGEKGSDTYLKTFLQCKFLIDT